MKCFSLAALVFALSSTAFALTLGPDVSTQYDSAFSIHGIGGDGVLIFALQPTSVPNHSLGVYVSRRGDGAHVGAVTPPPQGWQTPLAMKVTSYRDEGLFGTSGSFVLLDGFTPQAFGQQAIVYEYSYSYSIAGGLSSKLVSTRPLPLLTGADANGLPNGPAYPVSLAVLPDQTVVVIDFVLGSIWTAAPGSSQWNLAMIDPRFELGELTTPITGIGPAPGGGTRPYTFSTVSLPPQFPFPILPGIHGVAYCNPTDEVAVLRTATPGGIYGIAASVLTDTNTPSFAKGGSVREIVPPTPGISDLSVGLDYDRFNPETPWLYWQRVIADPNGKLNPVYRVSLFTGEIQLVAQSVTVYNWTNEISVLPSHLGPFFTVLTNANMQEENNSNSNALLNGVDTFVGPVIVPIAAFSNW